MTIMGLSKRHEFILLFTDQLQFDFEGRPKEINGMRVSTNFLGNFWRLAALLDNQITTEQKEKRLEWAEKNYAVDENCWGLGLTYYSFGRLHRNNFELSRTYFLQAIENFKKCQHYRGVYATAQRLSGLIDQSLLEKHSEDLIDVQAKMTQTYHKYKKKYELQKKFTLQAGPEKTLYDIICGEKKLEYEVTVRGVKEIGSALLHL